MLIITLVILVIITLSSMAMMLSMRAGISASGNIAFRQAATRVADIGLEQAFQWVGSQIAANETNLDGTVAASGYYATATEAATACVPSGVTVFNPALYDFANANCAVTLATQTAGYTLSYVIHRMATAAGACPAAGCMQPPSETAPAGSGSSQESGADQFSGAGAAATDKTVYYRITVKVSGPRRNNRFIQSFVY